MSSKPVPQKSNSALPSSPEIEKLILGAIILDSSQFAIVAQSISKEDLSLEIYRHIWDAMEDLQARGDDIDRITIANELQRQGKLESIGGLSFLSSLDTGLPEKVTLPPYCAIIKEKSRLRKLVRLSRDVYNAATAPDALASDVIGKNQAGLSEIGEALESKAQVIADYIDTYPGGINTLLDPSKREKGIPTGFSVLDQWTGGFHKSEIFLIGARPGVGKSSIGLDISRALGKGGLVTIFFSMEMPKSVCVDRLICENARISFQRFRAGTLQEDERRLLLPAATAVKSWPIVIDDTSGLTVPQISMRVQALANKQPVTLCVIDYVQLLRPEKSHKFSTDNEKYEKIALDLQLFSKQTGIPLLLLSQLTRESAKSADKRPNLSQCRGSGAWEQIANFGGLLFREWLTKRNRADLENVCELIVDKNRSGPSGTIFLRYESPLMSFKDAE